MERSRALEELGELIMGHKGDDGSGMVERGREFVKMQQNEKCA